VAPPLKDSNRRTRMSGLMAAQGVTFSQFRGDGPIRAKMVGIGSAGCNMLERAPAPSVAFSSSQADLDRAKADDRVLISPQKLVGLAQTDLAVIRQMPSVVADEICVPIEDTEVVFLMAGLGGLTGSVGMAVISSFARASGPMSVALAAGPFAVESERRRRLAELYTGRIMSDVDLMIEFSNDALSEMAPNLPVSRAFSIMNSIMHRPAIDILAAGTRKDIKILRGTIGDAVRGRLGLGLVRGDDRVNRVVDEAMSSPWFDFDPQETEAAILVYSAADPWDRELGEIVELMKTKLGDARLIHGSYSDPTLGEKIRLSVILCRTPEPVLLGRPL
jgi:cell division protein FtsZ